jgi:hypothetical protein
MTENYITLKQFVKLVDILKISVTLLESKLEECSIKVQKAEPVKFHSDYSNKRRHMLSLY